MTSKRKLISIQTEEVHRFRSSRKDAVASFCPSNASVSVVQIYDSSDFATPKSSVIIPGVVRCATSSSRGDFMGIISEDKCGITKSTTPEFEYFNVSSSSEIVQTVYQMQFAPVEENRIGILLGRDVRIYDITKSFSSPITTIPKPLAVISGAAAQASPVSFALDPNAPDLIVTGWDIPNNQYLRIVDLREGTHKSVRILKTPAVHEICLSQVDDRYIGSCSDSSISIFDMRKLCVPKSSSRSDPLFSIPTNGRAENLSWSPIKRATLAAGFPDTCSLRILRPDINRVVSIGGKRTYVWSRFDPSKVITMDEESGSISTNSVPEFSIPLIDPRSGAMGSTSGTTGRPRLLHFSELHSAVQAIAEKLGESPDNSLIDAIIKSDEETNFCRHLDWAFPDTVSAESVADPLINRIDPNPVPGDINRFGLIPFHGDPSRRAAIESLMPRKFCEQILFLMNGEFDLLLRSLIQDNQFQDHVFVQSLTMHVVGGSNEPLAMNELILDPIFQFTIQLVNQLIVADKKNIDNFLENIVCKHPSSETEYFVHCAFVVMYFPHAKLEIFFSTTDLSRTKVKSVRGIVVTGLKKANLSYCDPLHVALMGLLLLTNISVPDSAQSPQSSLLIKFLKFFRDLCNQLGGDSWSLRSIIDTVLVDSTYSSNGSTTMVCYYCNKSLMGDEFSWNATGVICRCPNRGCHKPLPSCSVCLEPINVAPTATVFCTTCRHGGHKDHLVDWFSSADECAVAGCNCQCANVDGC